MKIILLSSVAVVALASSAYAADIYAPEPIVEGAVTYSQPSFNWTGVYVGAQFGYGWADTDVDLDTGFIVPFPSDAFGFDSDGWLGGINIGADYQINQSWVVGLMADYNWSNIEGSFGLDDVFGTAFDLDGSAEIKSSWNILARAGYLVTPQTLVYVLGGYSQADLDYDFDVPGFGSDSGSETLKGWTVGIGGEHMWTEAISLKAEYRYTNWENFSYDAPGISADADADQHAVMLGVNFRFGMGQ